MWFSKAKSGLKSEHLLMKLFNSTMGHWNLIKTRYVPTPLAALLLRTIRTEQKSMSMGIILVYFDNTCMQLLLKKLSVFLIRLYQQLLLVFPKRFSVSACDDVIWVNCIKLYRFETIISYGQYVCITRVSTFIFRKE